MADNSTVQYNHDRLVNVKRRPENYIATSNNMKLVQWLLMGAWLLHLEEGTGRGRSPLRSLLAVPNITAHSSTVSVPITVLLDPVALRF